MSKVYLITGASKGIGYAMTENLTHKQDVVIYAGARNVEGSVKLNQLAAKHADKVKVVKLEATSEDDIKAVVKLIEAEHGRIDVVIANAGIFKNFDTVLNTKAADYQEHFDVNLYGPILLYQLTYPLLLKGPTGSRKFIAISSIVGSLAIYSTLPFSNMAYAASKSALNAVFHKAYQESEKDGVMPILIHPGMVASDGVSKMSETMPDFDVKDAIDPNESARGIIKIIDDAAPESHGGQFFSYNGDVLPW